MSSKEAYLHCDELENIPLICRNNWMRELDLIKEKVSDNASVLQVGSMDGKRLLAILNLRPDIRATGFEIEPDFVEICRRNLKEAKKDIAVIQGDITDPPRLETFDYILCLNNTLGYIPDQTAALEHMIALGRTIFVSVYGEKFDAIAADYFASLGLTIEDRKGHDFVLKDFGTVKRYSRSDIEKWTDKITETPIGYFCEISGTD